MSSSSDALISRVQSLVSTYADVLESVRALLPQRLREPVPVPRHVVQQRPGFSEGRETRFQAELVKRGLVKKDGEEEDEEEVKADAEMEVASDEDTVEDDDEMRVGRRGPTDCNFGQNTTATVASPLYNCTGTILTGPQFASRAANTICSSCAAGDVTCTTNCCTPITEGWSCVCPADLTGNICTSPIPYTCPPTLTYPDLSSCASPPCVLFEPTDSVNFTFTVTCSMASPLHVVISSTSSGYTDGTFQYVTGSGDTFAYSYSWGYNQLFRFKFYNWFHPSDTSQTYYIPLQPTSLAFIGGIEFGLPLNLSDVIAGGYVNGTDQYAAGGRLYFEGAVRNPGYNAMVGLNTNTSFKHFIDFQSPEPRTSNALLSDSSGPPLSTGALVGIVVAGFVVLVSVVNYCIKERRRTARG
ncbi:hypothetical protein HKX48_004447 [Thoreauomyces humboldtii]|nr:hypothetical protein HKX48_004447 [Thoreauomyces humboldtii]